MDDIIMIFGQEHKNFFQATQINSIDAQSHIYFRPVTHFLNWIMYRCFHANPVPYHMISTLFLALASTSLFFLIKHISQSKHLAFLTAMLFCVHPFNNVIVNYKNIPGFVLIITFINLSIYLQLLNNERKNLLLTLGSVLSFLLALFCHEVAIITPILLFLALSTNKEINLKKSVLHTTPLLISAGVYLILRTQYMSLSSLLTDNVKTTPLTFTEYATAITELFNWMLIKFVTTQSIVFIWEAQPSTTLSLIKTIPFIVLLTSCLAIRHKIMRFFLGCILITFLPVIPASLTRHGFGIYIEPHWVTFALIGFCGLMASFLLSLKNLLKPILWAGLLCIIMGFYLYQTHSYNALWQTQKRYCSYWIKHAPDNYWVNYWLGMSYLTEHDYEQAEIFFKHLIENGRATGEVYGNLGVVAFKQNHNQQALYYFNEALKRNSYPGKTRQYIEQIQSKMDKDYDPLGS